MVYNRQKCTQYESCTILQGLKDILIYGENGFQDGTTCTVTIKENNQNNKALPTMYRRTKKRRKTKKRMHLCLAARDWQTHMSLDKMFKLGMSALPRLRLASASTQSDLSLRCPYEESLGRWVPIERQAKTDQIVWMCRVI